MVPLIHLLYVIALLVGLFGVLGFLMLSRLAPGNGSGVENGIDG